MSLLRPEVTSLVLGSADLWPALAGSRIFLTGASGFFGCWLLETLLFASDHFEFGVEVVALTRTPDRFLTKAPHLAGHPRVTLWPGDMQDFSFPPGPFSHIIHGAAEVNSDLGLLAGGKRVLELESERFLLISSGAVYGPAAGFISEEHPASPITDYGRAKLQLEQACNPRAVIARCFTFLGPYLSLHSGLAAADFLRDALACRPLKLQGNGETRRSYLYAGDLAIWLWTLLLRGTPGRSYNVGSMDAIPVIELARRIAGPNPVQVLGKEAGSDYLPDTTRARQELDLRQTVDLDEAVARTWNWLGR
ncbi:MAG: NAD-dependent epimerase/dehydratase family protein [Candidatus Eremiobacteraeota bacterium]|nr:NAD-dependent epimerase/dehydratase family protein [Candidatus Eremiobacteraeota bacterium]